MKRAWADLVAYGKQYLRSPTATFFTLAFPILLILLFGGIFGGAEDVEVALHVQDQDGSPSSELFLDLLNETGVLSVVMVPGGTNLTEYIREQSVTAALLIPNGFGDEVGRAAAGDQNAKVNLTLYGDFSNAAFGTVRGAVAGAVTTLNFIVSDARPVVGLDAESVSQESFTYIDFFLPGVIGITLLTPLFALANTSAEYRERHYFKLLATTPLRKSEFLASRTVWMLLLIYASTILMILVARLAFDAVFVLDAVAVALIAAGTVAFVSLGMIIRNFIHEVESAAAVANIVYFPMMFLSGTFWPVDIMPTYIQPVARVLPLTFVTDGLRDTSIFGNLTSALENLLVVAVLAVVLFAIAARTMSWRAE